MLKSLLKRFRKPNPPVVTIGIRTIFSAHAYAPEILAKIENDQDLTGIPTAFWLLLSDDPALKIRAARGITYLVRPLPILQLANLDSLFRERTSLEWVHDWRNEDPAVSLIGQIALSKWQLRYNSSFTAPSQTQLEGIQAALKKYQTAIPGAARHFIEFTLKAFILKP